jgi:hypothetical protein
MRARRLLRKLLSQGCPAGAAADLAARAATADADFDHYDRLLRRSTRQPLLGRPLSRDAVRLGRHPIALERVRVFRRSVLGDPLADLATPTPVERPVIAALSARRPAFRGDMLAPAKRAAVVRLMNVITAHYRLWERFESWAGTLHRREALGSTGVGRGFALLHQFQTPGPASVDSPPVDWWLLLFPDGLDWDALDAAPVYAMLGPVFEAGPGWKTGLELRVYEAICRVARDVDWKRLAALPPAEAARAVNAAALAGVLSRP